ncbi:hypothetical protein FQA39_LY11585 [Lamprigera yunnana]|nr:hypothetical protein FQA39_LY11585 [Lamprigera yunnana]
MIALLFFSAFIMSVHYKFKSALEYDTVTFDGLHISVRDLKNAIMQQKRIGKNTDFDLQITNAQTKEIYDDDEALIPKNTSLLIARIPSLQAKPKTWEGYGGNSSPVLKIDDGGPVSKAMDLSSLDASEEDKIKAMMSQSTQDYDPSNYLKIRGANQMGAVPTNYRCFKCHQGGHWIKDCPLSLGSEPIEIKKSTGIPRSFMVPVDGPQVPGAMMTPNGSFAVPVLDHKAYTEKPQPAPPEEKKPEIPEDLLCSLCSDLLTDAVMIPCCGDSYCDECIRSCLLESEEHECPACHERDISPGTLIPNRYLRNSVANFKSTTGYVKRLVHKPSQTSTKEQLELQIDITKEISSIENIKELSSPPAAKTEVNEKTIIREADSTETQKVNTSKVKEDFTEDIDLKEVPNKTSPVPEGPPGVSPHPESSPKAQRITNITISRNNNRTHQKMSTKERSPRRPHHVQRSPNYQEMSRSEDRPGTPTVDEPGIGTATTLCSTTVYHSAPTHFSSGPPPPNMPNILNAIMGMPPPNMQGPPPMMQNSFSGQPLTASYPPPNQGPPPNFRLPPPGGPPYMGGSTYNVPSRPVYDCNRPPIAGPPAYPMYPSGPRPNRGRDYSRDLPRRGRTPPRIIDDPLEAFNRMLREKDERERRAKQRKRSFSRSSSRSFSPSPRRLRSRSPRRRSRSRSRSFSISRSRSRSFSPSLRTSPPRQYSPKRSHRFRSPIRSPPRYRFKEQPLSERERVRERDVDRERDREKDFRERDRDNGNYNRDRDRERDFRDRENRDREYGYVGYDRDRQRGRQQWGGQSISRKDYPGPDSYYHPQEMSAQATPFVPLNRYPPREAYAAHHIPTIQHPPTQPLPQIRRYEDVAPPGTEQPPVPGLENAPRFDDRYPYEPTTHETHQSDKFSPTRANRDLDKIEVHEHRDDMNLERERERKHERISRSPDRNRGSSPKRPSKEQEHRDRPTYTEKHKRRRNEESLDREKRDYERTHDRKREPSDDERLKKNKDKKKKKDKREKKEEEKKKRKERREKREQEKQKKAEEKEKNDRKGRTGSKKSDSENHSTQNEYDERNTDNKYIENQTTEELIKYETEKSLDKVYLTNEVSQETNEPIDDEFSERSKNVIDIKSDFIDEERKSEIAYENKRELSPKLEDNHDLYGDILSEGIDNTVIENYGKLRDVPDDVVSNNTESSDHVEKISKDDSRDEGELSCDESEKDILELHTNEAELKADLDNQKEVLAPLPERSKWEVDDDALASGSSLHNRGDNKLDRLEKSGKVTNEVLKRAENAIFAKAINAIRPIEIKKISLDRAKLYSGERDRDKKSDDIRDDVRNIQVTIAGDTGFDDDVIPVEAVEVSKPRLSVKERLGCKVDDLDRIVKIDKPYDRNRSRSLSPLSRRAGELNRNLGQGERRIEIEDRKRVDSKILYAEKGRDRHHRQFRLEREPRRDLSRRENRDVKRDFRRDRERDYRKDERRTERKDVARFRSDGRGNDRSRDEDKKNRDKRKFSKSPSTSNEKDRRKRKDKKEKKKEKTKKHKKDDDDKESYKSAKNESDEKSVKLKPTTDKRKTTLDEASFEPDYDLESESEKEDGMKRIKEEKAKKRSVSQSAEEETIKKKPKVEEKKCESSSSDSSDSSSDDGKKKKKHRKHKKKKSRKDSSSSSESDSDSDSSEDEKDKRKRRHKKKLRKKRKSKHK